MSECRDLLGAHHLPPNRDGTYQAGPGVGTDLDLFDWHTQRAAHLDPPEAVAHYQAALALVTGRPFSYPTAARASFGWVDLEHHATTWEHRIATTARTCAELQLGNEDHGSAIAMLRRLVPAVPLNPVIVEWLMRAHAAAEDSAAAERIYREHAEALRLGDLGEPDEAIEALRRRRRRA